MATFPVITYSNISHKVANGVNNGQIIYTDEAITPDFTRTVDGLHPYRISYHAPYNQITGTFTANRPLTRFEIRVTPVEETSYGPGEGAEAFVTTGIRSGRSENFTIPINFTTFTGSPSGKYRVCLLAQSELDHSWDCTQLYMVVGDNDFLDNYTEVRYLESTGTQYIDTGLRVKPSIGLEIVLLPTNPGADERFFGAYDNGIFLGQLANKWRYGNTCDKNDVNIDYAGRTIITASGTAWSFNGIEKTAGAIGDRGNKMLLFGASYRADTLFGAGCCQIYSCKIYDGVVIVRDFIPCIRKSDGKPGMYDTIEKQFYTNAGSDEFLTGKITRLADQYQEVEYIETTGNQVIDTGVVDDWNITVDCDMEITEARSQYWYGSTQYTYTVDETTIFSAMMYNGLYNNNRIEYDWKSITLPASNRKVMTQRVNEGIITMVINGTTYLRDIGTYYIRPSGNIFIFSCNNGTRKYGSGLKLRMFKIYRDNMLIRDFIPCYRKSDNVIGLYDRVGEFFYTNQGEGAFTYGPLTTLPNEYQELAFIESRGNQYVDTGIPMNTISQINCIAKNTRPTDVLQYNPLFGRYSSNNNTCQLLENYSANGITARFGSQFMTIFTDNAFHTFNVSKTNIRIDEQQLTYSEGNLADTASLLVFARRTDNSGDGIQQYGYWAVKSLKIYNLNGDLVRNYVPCYKKSNNAAGLFDLISGTFQANLNNGNSFRNGAVIPAVYNKFKPIDKDGFEVHWSEWKASRDAQYIADDANTLYGYNQLCINGDFSSGKSNWSDWNSTTVINNGIAEITRTNTSQSSLHQDISANPGDKIYVRATMWSDGTTPVRLGLNGGISWSGTATTSTTPVLFEVIRPVVSNGNGCRIELFGTGVADTKYYVKEVNAINLTTWYGSGNEPTTVAEFKQKFGQNYYGFCETPVQLIRYQIEELPRYGYNQLIAMSQKNNYNGITWTPRNNGVYTLTGTSTNTYSSWGETLVDNHKYLLTLNILTNPNNIQLKIGLLNVSYGSTDYITSGSISKIVQYTPGSGKSYGIVYPSAGQILDGMQIQVMNIDLTDWYGAGNEPTTVEQFKQTFPAKYYPYSKKSLLNKYMINKLGINN